MTQPDNFVMGFKVEGSDDLEKIEIPVDFQHILYTGATGSGKTASLVLPTLKDRLEKGHMVLFFDHKGHEHKKVKYLAQQVGRLEDVVEIGKPHTSYINLLSELDIVSLKEMIKNDSGIKDPYWSNAAANLIEDILEPLLKLYDIVEYIQNSEKFKNRYEKSFAYMKKNDRYFLKKPTFQTISDIVANPKRLETFQKAITALSKSLLIEHNSIDIPHSDSDTIFAMHLKGKILKLQNIVNISNRFTLNSDSSESGGNNGVLQILDNIIASYAKKDYMNIDKFTINEFMDKRAIIIVDAQSFGENIMKVFLESFIKKAMVRLRNGKEMATSIFIDEANRVLYPSIDLHSDTLREAKVELIIAIQNEEQMIDKFGDNSWRAIIGNIKHQYSIDIKHNIHYKNKNMKTKPMLIENQQLTIADISYFDLEKNRKVIEDNFIGDSFNLPKEFSVIYDINTFEQKSSIIIRDIESIDIEYSYFGEKIVNSIIESYSYAELMKYREYLEEIDPDEIAYSYDDDMKEFIASFGKEEEIEF